MSRFISLCLVLSIVPAVAQVAAQTDPVYWCNISRSQVSAERDAGLAQIAMLQAHIKDLETKNAALKAEAAKTKESKPHE